VNLHVQRDAVIEPVDRPGEIVATVLAGNPLGDEGVRLEARGRWLVAWSGTLADELFSPHPATWLRPGHEALASFCAVAASALGGGEQRLCFHPHARHVLSDPQSCLTFLRDHDGEPFDVALAPGSMLETSMLDDLEDHLRRSFEVLGERCAMVLLADVAPAADAVHPAPLGGGVLPRNVIMSLLRDLVPAETPIVLQDAKLEDQIGWLS
jgi:hypothetical protein